MSLIRVRRDRKKEWITEKKARSPRVLMIVLIFVLLAIWYLSTQI